MLTGQTVWDDIEPDRPWRPATPSRPEPRDLLSQAREAGLSPAFCPEPINEDGYA